MWRAVPGTNARNDGLREVVFTDPNLITFTTLRHLPLSASGTLDRFFPGFCGIRYVLQLLGHQILTLMQ